MAELNREEKIQKFLDMVEASDNIVFFGGIPFTGEIPKNFIDSIGIKCCVSQHSPIWRIKNWQN